MNAWRSGASIAKTMHQRRAAARATTKLSVRPTSASRTTLSDPAERAAHAVRRLNRRRTREHEQPADDLRAGHDRRRQAGDAVGRAVAVQLEQVRLEGIERVDADARRERGRQHQPADRRVAQAAVDRAAHDGRGPPSSGSRSRAGVKPRSCMNHQATTRVTPSSAGADEVRHAQVGRLGDASRRPPSRRASRRRPRSAPARRPSRGCR